MTVSLLNAGDLFFNLWKEMRLFSRTLRLLECYLKKNKFMKPFFFLLMPILNRKRSSFEYCRAILEDDSCFKGKGQLSVAFQVVI